MEHAEQGRCGAAATTSSNPETITQAAKGLRRWPADCERGAHQGRPAAWSGSLERLADYSTEDPPLTLIVGLAATAAVLVVLHVIQAAGLATGSAALAALPVGVAVSVPVGCLAVLLWLLRHTRLVPDQPGYALAVVFSVATLCVGAEALAGLTTLLWQHGVIRPATP